MVTKCSSSVIGYIQQVWLSLTKYEKRVMEFKSEYFFFPSFGNFNRHKYLVSVFYFRVHCSLFSSFFYPRRIYENISIREEFYIYLFFFFCLSLDGKLSDRRNSQHRQNWAQRSWKPLVKYSFHPFPLYFYCASHRKIILSLWRNGGKNGLLASFESIWTLSASITAILLSKKETWYARKIFNRF